MTLQNLIEKMGYKTRSYSGRGMFGKYCLGVSIDGNLATFLMELGAAIGEHNAEAGCTGEERIDLPYSTSDALGLGTIVYFPNVQYVEADENEDLDEGDEERRNF